MAQVVVDSTVMRDKAKVIENAAVKIDALYTNMLQDVTTTANKMKGTAIETAKAKFAGMEDEFETIVADMKAYSKFLIDAAEAFEAAQNAGTNKAEEQGEIF